MLGGGGLGAVYKARDTRLHRRVAVKVLAPELASDSTFKARFEREARAISALNHPHICMIHDVGEDEGVGYLVSSIWKGTRLRTSEPVSRGRSWPTYAESISLADALDAAHGRHRPSRPQAGKRHADGGRTEAPRFRPREATGGGEPPRRPHSPRDPAPVPHRARLSAPCSTWREQIQAQPVDARTDIFALGALLYEMATGRRAFEAQSQAWLIAKILETKPPEVSWLAPASPPALDHAVRGCLAKDPEEWWQTARDLLLELRWIQENEASGAVLAPHPRRTRRWLPWGVAAAASLAAASIWALRPPFTEPARPPVRFDVPLPPKMQPLAEWQGAPSLSPDGRYVAVTASVEGRMQLLLRPLDDTTFQALPGTDDARVPFWSPDSRSVAFFASGKLRRVAATGGPATTICDAGDITYGGSWSEAGVILFSMGGVIYRVAESGGAPVAVMSTDARGDGEHRYPHFLPDGQSFLFSLSDVSRESTSARSAHRRQNLSYPMAPRARSSRHRH